MTKFEFVFGLISIITSLALTHLVTGLISFVRRGRHVRFSLRHGLWVWAGFALVLANWAAYWAMRDNDWQAQSLLLGLMQMIGLYAFAALLIPETAGREPVNLVAFHQDEGRRYIAAHALFALLVIIGFAANAATPTEWLRGSSFAWLGLFISIVAIVARPTWLEQAAAVAIAVLATYFMLVRISVLSA